VLLVEIKTLQHICFYVVAIPFLASLHCYVRVFHLFELSSQMLGRSDILS